MVVQDDWTTARRLVALRPGLCQPRIPENSQEAQRVRYATDSWIEPNFKDGTFKNNRRLLFFPLTTATKLWSAVATTDADPFKDEDARAAKVRADKSAKAKARRAATAKKPKAPAAKKPKTAKKAKHAKKAKKASRPRTAAKRKGKTAAAKKQQAS